MHHRDASPSGLSGYLSARQKISPLVALGELNYQSGFQLAANVIEPQTTALVCALRYYRARCDEVPATATGLRQSRCAPSVIRQCSTSCSQRRFPLSWGYGTAGQQAALQLLGQFEW
ncbi:trehalose repressor [Serratia fonticola]|uniref:Trehalose repressor n=1 Tax=Serratia fonticola TaxID=47917 RepID=A0A4U9TWR3_SERFO|nr:trehalose repressor [Serratia fonticola]